MAKIVCNVISYVLKRTVDITVVIPTPTIPEAALHDHVEDPCTHTPKAKYPVLYLLHGRGNNHATWTGYTNVELYAEERQIAVVNISAEDKRYTDYGIDHFFTFMSQELPDFICGMFPISSRPEDTYIAGLSMGGYGTFIHGLNAPDRFAAIGGLSPSVKRVPPGADLYPVRDYGFNEPQYDPDMLAENLAAAGRAFPKIYMACGEKDPGFEVIKEYRDKLIRLGADVTWDQLPQYGHEWRFWDIEIEKFLDWIPRTDYYANMGKRKM